MILNLKLLYKNRQEYAIGETTAELFSLREYSELIIGKAGWDAWMQSRALYKAGLLKCGILYLDAKLSLFKTSFICTVSPCFDNGSEVSYLSTIMQYTLSTSTHTDLYTSNHRGEPTNEMCYISSVPVLCLFWQGEDQWAKASL